MGRAVPRQPDRGHLARDPRHRRAGRPDRWDRRRADRPDQRGLRELDGSGMTDEPTVADVRRAYPDWTVCQGTDLRWRARLTNAKPPVPVVVGEDPEPSGFRLIVVLDRRLQLAVRLRHFGVGGSARLDLAHRTEAVMWRVDVDDLRLRGHEVRRGVEEPLYVRLFDVGGSRLGVLEALDADELVLVGEAPGELKEQAAILGVDVLGVRIRQCQPL